MRDSKTPIHTKEEHDGIPSGILRLAIAPFEKPVGVIENVIHIDIRLHLARIGQPEEPAETEIQLFDPLPEERVVGDQVDRGSLRTGSRGLAGARREMPAQRLPDFSIADHVARPYWESRLVLVDSADLDAGRKRIDSIETE